MFFKLLFYDFHLAFSQNFQKLAKLVEFLHFAGWNLEKVKKTLDFVTFCTT